MTTPLLSLRRHELSLWALEVWAEDSSSQSSSSQSSGRFASWRWELGPGYAAEIAHEQCN